MIRKEDLILSGICIVILVVYSAVFYAVILHLLTTVAR